MWLKWPCYALLLVACSEADELPPMIGDCTSCSQTPNGGGSTGGGQTLDAGEIDGGGQTFDAGVSDASAAPDGLDIVDVIVNLDAPFP